MASKAKELQEMSEKPRFFTALRSVLRKSAWGRLTAESFGQNDKMSFSYTFQEIIGTTDNLAKKSVANLRRHIIIPA